MWHDILRSQCGLIAGKPVVAGVSGGPDSLCLLDVLQEAGYTVIVAHFNHCLRLDADREAAAVQTMAAARGLDFITDSADVGAHAANQGFSLEQAARILRYHFLFAAARVRGAQAVAVGHTADDQAETVLMHFLRGAGLSGLKGMSPRTRLPEFDPGIPLVRPLLGLWRADTEAYCRERGLQPVYDLTNADPAYLRNRLRLELIPELEQHNPRFKQALVRSAQVLQGDFELLGEVLDAAWERAVCGQEAGYVAFARPALEGMSLALRRNLFRRAATTLRPGLADLDFAALERAAALQPADLTGGLRIFVEADKVYLAACEADLPLGDYPRVGEPATLVSHLDLDGGWTLSADSLPLEGDDWSSNTNPWTAWLDAELVGNSLMVRARRAGDRFQPLGMPDGTLTLQDFFVNLKLPQRARANWPLVCAGEQIVWVAGFRIAHPLRVTAGTRRVLRLHLRKK
ncbi:MAG: tRNA lysidine(34) synthetase TilS [Anaerolineales bacterium]|nr:tRNA lysidine(34) synthetase TilS [Anaerolineales bacterium]